MNGIFLRNALLLVCSAAAVASFFTWPIVRHPAGYARIDSGDGLFSVWNVGWVARALTTRETGVYDANIFHPHRGTLAFSEPNLGAGTLGIPAYLLTGDAVAAHNAAVLAGFTFCLIGTALLVWRHTRSAPASFVAAVLFTFCPYVFSHTSHIQLMMTFGIPWALLAMHGFLDRPTWRRALVLGISLAIQALFCGYYGILAGMLVGLGCVYFGWSRGTIREPIWWLKVGAAAATSVVLVLPFFLPVVDMQRDTGFSRPLEEAATYAADWRGYLASSAWAHRWMLPHIGRFAEVLFPGFVSIALAVVGLTMAWRRPGSAGDRPAEPGRRREIAGYYALVAVFACWISLGPDGGLYALLYKTVPTFSLLRAPGRFGIAVMLGLAVLAGFGVAALTRGGGLRRRAAGVILCVAAVGDMWTPWPARPVATVPPAYETLALLPPGPVVAMPFFASPPEFYRHAYYMFMSTYHWQPLVNGYSDHIPDDYRALASAVVSFPSREAFDELKPRGARYVLFHPRFYRGARLEAARRGLQEFQPYLKEHVTAGDVWLYEIVAWPD